MIEPVRQPDMPARLAKYLVAILLVAFAVIMVRTSWLADDAFITFRVADNAVNGFGLRWNVVERVQAYTNPLWLFVFTFVYYFTGEYWLTPLVLTMTASLLAVAVFAFLVAESGIAAAAGIVVLLCSGSFMDYSTSGLENPLTHLLIALFFYVFFRLENALLRPFMLSLLASLLMLDRLDTILLIFPALVYGVSGQLDRKAVLRQCIAGFLPIIAWEIFSLIYYGFPFPNTYYAKVHTGLAQWEISKQGWMYFLSTFQSDPIVPFTILAGIVAAISAGRPKKRLAALGVIIFLVYLVRVGGDFMTGRFLTAPLFVSVMILARSGFLGVPSNAAAFAVAALIFGYAGTNFPPLLDQNDTRFRHTDQRGIANERTYYAHCSGLLMAERTEEMPTCVRAHVDAFKADGTRFLERGDIGYLGFFSGPEMFILDPAALAEPLLARLPAKRYPFWRIGHFSRVLPDGYAESRKQNKNLLTDKRLAEFYGHLVTVTQGDIWSFERFREIFNFNLGFYNHLIDDRRYAYGGIEYPVKMLSERKPDGTKWDYWKNIILADWPVTITPERIVRARAIEISLDSNDTYELTFLRDNMDLGTIRLDPFDAGKGGLSTRTVELPAGIAGREFDLLRLKPLFGDDKYAIGHIYFLE